jgi:hypothetical protein
VTWPRRSNDRLVNLARGEAVDASMALHDRDYIVPRPKRPGFSQSPSVMAARYGEVTAMEPILAAPRFLDRYKPPQVRWGDVGIIVNLEERPGPNSGTDC